MYDNYFLAINGAMILHIILFPFLVMIIPATVIIPCLVLSSESVFFTVCFVNRNTVKITCAPNKSQF